MEGKRSNNQPDSAFEASNAALAVLSFLAASSETDSWTVVSGSAIIREH